MADKLSNDGFLIKTNKQEPTKETDDMQADFNDLTAQDEDNLLFEDTKILKTTSQVLKYRDQSLEPMTNMKVSSL